MNNKIIPFLCIFMIAVPTLAFAHGGGHEEKNNSDSQGEETRALNNSIYAIDSEKDTEPPIVGGDPLGFSLSNTDILSGEDLLTGVGTSDGEPMIRFKKQVDPQSGHSQHEKQNQHVEKATHEWVTFNSKGHGVAAGITIIAGLVFAALSFFRIGEGMPKIPHNH